MKSDIAVSLKNVSKYYKLYKGPKDRLKEALSPFGKIYHQKFYATNSINLEIKKGEILGIVGKNGSGKSTLLKLITSVLMPDEGSIQIKGKISALLELGSGFNPEFSGYQNIFFYGTILGFSKKEMNEKLEDIIEFADIGEFMDQPLKTYSSGMKSRLAFSVAVHIDPEILILDEVLSVGDIHFKRKSYAKMQEFFESGKTIIYVSHSSGEVNRLCTRAIMLHDGEILIDGEPKEVTKYYEKYLFAKDENKKTILDEIKNKVPQIQIVKKEEIASKNAIDTSEKPFFIEGFESENIMEYDNSLLEIYDIRIETLNGIKVNNLITNERYNYCYKLKFKKSFHHVYYGMQFMNDKGILISGAAYEESIKQINENDILEIKWNFNCSMHKGVYYTNTAVVDSEKKYINRIVDSYMFKVLPSKKLANGLVSLQETVPIITTIKEK